MYDGELEYDPDMVSDDDDDIIPGGVSEAQRQEAEAALEDLREMGVELTPDEAEAVENGGFTINELQRLVDNLEKISRLGAENPLLKGQWSRSGGRYALIGETTQVLPPGYYDTIVDQAGTIWFEPVRARTDKLLRFPD